MKANTDRTLQERAWRMLRATGGCRCKGIGAMILNTKGLAADDEMIFSCICKEADVRARWAEAIAIGDTIPDVAHLTNAHFGGPAYAAALDAFSALIASREIQTPRGTRYGALLWGVPGVGKSSLAALVRAELAKGLDTLWIAYSPFIRKVQDTYSPDAEHSADDVIGQASSVSVLVIDDLGRPTLKGPETNNRIEIMEAVIDARWLAHRITIVTTNLTLPRLEEQFGSRLYSRLLGLCHAVEVVGIDHRIGVA
jgi:DNA replication protein DnaC